MDSPLSQLMRSLSKTITSFQTLNGRVIFVDYAKPNINTRGEIPIARGPPEPTSTPDT